MNRPTRVIHTNHTFQNIQDSAWDCYLLNKFLRIRSLNDFQIWFHTLRTKLTHVRNAVGDLWFNQEQYSKSKALWSNKWSNFKTCWVSWISVPKQCLKSLTQYWSKSICKIPFWCTEDSLWQHSVTDSECVVLKSEFSMQDLLYRAQTIQNQDFLLPSTLQTSHASQPKQDLELTIEIPGPKPSSILSIKRTDSFKTFITSVHLWWVRYDLIPLTQDYLSGPVVNKTMEGLKGHIFLSRAQERKSESVDMGVDSNKCTPLYSVFQTSVKLHSNHQNLVTHK